MLSRYCVDFKRSPVRVTPSRWLKKFAGIAALFLSLAVCIADSSHAQSIAPFKRLAGQWSGSGTIDLTDGKREPIRCRASYDVLSDQRNLQLNIRCASDRLAEKDAALATTLIWSPSALPEIVPATRRVASLQVPDTEPAEYVALARKSKL